MGDRGSGDRMPIEFLTCYICEEDNGGPCHIIDNPAKNKDLGMPSCCPYGLNVYADFTGHAKIQPFPQCPHWKITDNLKSDFRDQVTSRWMCFKELFREYTEVL